MAIRNEYTLPNDTKLRVAGNNLEEVGVVLSAIGDRLQDLLERRLTGIDYVHLIEFGDKFVKYGETTSPWGNVLSSPICDGYREASPVVKVQITLTTLMGGRREGILEVFEARGVRTWVRFSPTPDAISKLAVFFQRRGRKAQYGKNCHCQVCQTVVLDDMLKPNRICEDCAFIVIN